MQNLGIFRTLRKKIANGKDYWFTCIEHPHIEPTNNSAEQALRGPITIRKISGGFKSLKGGTTAATLYTITQHLKHNHPQNHPTTLKQLLIKTNNP